MTILLLLLMAYERIGRKAHEWIGAAMFALLVLHHVRNASWSKRILKGRYTALRSLQTALVLAVLLCMAGSMVSGVILSRHAFAFLAIRSGQSWARTLHLLCAYWGFVLMNLHLGFHWSMMMGMARKHFGAASGRRTWLLQLAAAVIAMYGIFAVVRRGIGDYMLLRSEFVFFDFSEPLIHFFLDYLAVMGLAVCIGHYFAVLLKWRNQRRRAK